MKLSQLQKMNIIRELEAEGSITAATELLEHRIRENINDNPDLTRELLELAWDELCVFTVDGEAVTLNYISSFFEREGWMLRHITADDRDDFLDNILIASKIIYPPSENEKADIEDLKRTRKIYMVLLPIFRVNWKLLEKNERQAKEKVKLTLLQIAFIILNEGIPEEFIKKFPISGKITKSSVDWLKLTQYYSNRYNLGSKSKNGHGLYIAYKEVKRGDEHNPKAYWRPEWFAGVKPLLSEEGVRELNKRLARFAEYQRKT